MTWHIPFLPFTWHATVIFLLGVCGVIKSQLDQHLLDIAISFFLPYVLCLHHPSRFSLFLLGGYVSNSTYKILLKQKTKEKKKGSRIEDGTVGKCERQRPGSHRGDTNGPVSVPHFTFLRLHTQSLKEEHKQVWTLAFPTHGSELPNRVGLQLGS